MDSEKGKRKKPENAATSTTMTGGSSSAKPETTPSSMIKSSTKRPNEDCDTKQKKRKKVKKPDGYPTRPLSAYNFFFKDERVKWLEEEHDDNKEGQNAFLGMSAAIGTRWKALSEDQKQQYEKAAEEDRIRYKKEMDEYSEKLIRDAAEERMSSSERQIRTTLSQSSMDQQSVEASREQTTQIQPPSNTQVQPPPNNGGVDITSQLQQLLQANSGGNASELVQLQQLLQATSGGNASDLLQMQQLLQATSGSGGNSSDLVQLLPFLLTLQTPIPQNLSVAELLDELQRVQSLTDMLLRSRLGVNQNPASQAQSLLSILQLLGQ